MIYVSLSTIPQRLKSLNESVEHLVKQTRKPDKIFINIPFKLFNLCGIVLNET